MQRKRNVSNRTKINWLLDASLFLSAIAATLSGIYFMYFPSGGYMGGRNPAYSLVVIFQRSGWEIIHTWGGSLMIVIAFGHLFYHWKWVKSMARRIWQTLRGDEGHMSKRGWMNLWLNVVVAFSFLLTSVSGIYFLFVGGSQGGRVADPMILFSRTVWDLVHTWAGAILIVAAILHFAIHWRWVMNVTRKVIGVSISVRESQQIV